MALTATEEALLRDLLAKQAELIALANNETTITAKLGSTKATIDDLTAATTVADADLMILRQGGVDKKLPVSVVKSDLVDLSSVSTTFASSAENAAGTVENKAVDPLGIREAFNASGSAPVYACRAWVNFKGTGTVAIRASGNVSSITDNGAGDYTVNFATAMPDVNYSVTGSAMEDIGSQNTAIFTAPVNTDAGGTRTTTAAKVGAVVLGGAVSNVDAGYMSVAIFR